MIMIDYFIFTNSSKYSFSSLHIRPYPHKRKAVYPILRSSILWISVFSNIYVASYLAYSFVKSISRIGWSGSIWVCITKIFLKQLCIWHSILPRNLKKNSLTPCQQFRDKLTSTVSILNRNIISWQNQVISKCQTH